MNPSKTAMLICSGMHVCDLLCSIQATLQLQLQSHLKLCQTLGWISKARDPEGPTSTHKITAPQLHFVSLSVTARMAVCGTYLLPDDAHNMYSATQNTNKQSVCRCVHLASVVIVDGGMQ